MSSACLQQESLLAAEIFAKNHQYVAQFKKIP